MHLLLTFATVALTLSVAAEPLPGTKPLTAEGDLAAQMVAGIDKYLMRELAASPAKRQAFWKPDYSSLDAYAKSVRPNRERLKQIIGVVDERLPPKLEYVGGPGEPALIAEGEEFKVFAVRWAVFPGVDAEGLLFGPNDGDPVGNLIVIPEADWTPEMVAGLTPGVSLGTQVPFGAATRGFRVLVPTLINRKDDSSGNPKVGRFTNQPHREFIYRMAYEMGRHILGYEVQKVLAAADWMRAHSKAEAVDRLAVIGYGEGGLLARLAAAVDERIKFVAPLGHGGPAEGLWAEPIYRNVWGYLREFGTAELYRLTIPRVLSAEPQTVTRGGVEQIATDLGWPVVNGPPARPGRAGAAPGRLLIPSVKAVQAERDRAWKTAVSHLPNNDPVGYALALALSERNSQPVKYAKVRRQTFDDAGRQKRQFEQLVAFTQRLMRDSEQRRKESLWSKLDTSTPAKFEASTRPFRDQFWEEVIGKLPEPTQSTNPRTRLAYDEPKWKGYEITLDLYPDVFAYGILLLPKDVKPGERRPVVVCQHGLEGRPQDVVNPKERTKHYNSFGAQLADRGFIVYAPQNPYIGQDKFRVLQRKANPLGLSLFSFIVRQHERTLDWLAGLPFVDAERIAFYGLSYGGKTAMRVPALLPRYCLSICSGDFNEWIRKNVSVDFPGSYMFSGEYEMPEFNLGHTFDYAEMAALIAPRPFMVERGHQDGVGIDEWVAYEYAKVRRLYAQLGLPERTAIEFFNGGHEIHGKGTFAFLEKHLRWPSE
jgi:dienelactone hydrolase